MILCCFNILIYQLDKIVLYEQMIHYHCKYVRVYIYTYSKLVLYFLIRILYVEQKQIYCKYCKNTNQSLF